MLKRFVFKFALCLTILGSLGLYSEMSHSETQQSMRTEFVRRKESIPEPLNFPTHITQSAMTRPPGKVS